MSQLTRLKLGSSFPTMPPTKILCVVFQRPILNTLINNDDVLAENIRANPMQHGPATIALIFTHVNTVNVRLNNIKNMWANWVATEITHYLQDRGEISL